MSNMIVQPPPPPPQEIIPYTVAMNFQIDKALNLLGLPLVDREDSPSHFTMLNELKYARIETLYDLQIKWTTNSELDSEIQHRLRQNNRLYHVEKIREILFDLCGLSVDSPYDLREFLTQDRILSIGDPILDDMFDGGLRCGSLYEICGESSCGKTQFCLQLVLQCICPYIMGGLNSRSCYITTENYPRNRLIEMIKFRLDTLHNYISKVEGKSYPNLRKVEQFLDRILVRERVIYTIEEFNQVIYGVLQETIQNLPIRLLVIDSIAALYRTPRDYGEINYQSRAKELWTLASFLKKLAFERQICIVLVNHVADRMSNFRSLPKCRLSAGREIEMDDSTYMGSQRDKKPALGLFWSSMINTRIYLSRKKGCQVLVRNEQRATKRKLLNDRSVIFVYKESLKNKNNNNNNIMNPQRRKIEEEEEEEEEGEGFDDDDETRKKKRKGSNEKSHDGNFYHHREIKVIFSPHLKEGISSFFSVEDVGVRGIKVIDEDVGGGDLL